MRKLGRIATAALALAAIAAIVIEIRASARWAEFTARTNQLRAKLEAERGEREPLVGPPRAGNAWDEYAPALVELTRETASEVGDEVARPASATRAYATVHAAAPILARLREAVRCDRAFAEVIPPLIRLQHAEHLFILSARERMLAGDADGALDELAVALQLGSDAGRAPGLIGVVIGLSALSEVARELAALMSDARVTFAHLKRIDGLLEALDRQFPSLADAVQWESVLVRQTLREVAEGTRELEVDFDSPVEAMWLSENRRLVPWKVSLVAWRNGFSRRLLAAEQADWHERLVKVAQRTETMNCRDADAIRRELPAAPFRWVAMPDAHRAEARSWRETRGRLRLIRAAARVRRGLEPDRVDPVTLKPVGVRVEPECIVLWLPWGKGSGTGTWEARRGDDLVLVVR